MKTKHLAITFGIVCLLLSIVLHYCTPKPKHVTNNYDSLLNENKALHIQYGMMSAEAQAQGLRAARAELKARERDTIYLTRTRTIFKEAPDTCLPYLIALQSECDTLVQLHVNSEMAKDTLIDTLKAIIVNRNEVIENDSIVTVGLKQEVKMANKQTRKERNGKRAAIGVGIVMFLLWLGTGIGN